MISRDSVPPKLRAPLTLPATDSQSKAELGEREHRKDHHRPSHLSDQLALHRDRFCGWVVRWLGGWLFVWLGAGWPGGQVAGWLADWVVGWFGWLGGVVVCCGSCGCCG